VIAAGAVIGSLRHHVAGRSLGPRIAFASGNGIDEIDLTGRERRAILKGAALGREGFALLPDGSLVIASAQRLVHVGGHGRRLGDFGRGVLPALSPDGSQLAFAVLDAAGTASQVGVMNADGSGRRLLTSGKLDTGPGWSLDGTTILFTRYSTSGASAEHMRSWLETIPVSGGRPHRLTNGGYDVGGRYSPDGQWIAFASGRNRVGQICTEDDCHYALELFVMRSDGSDQHRVGRDRVVDGLPVFATPTTIVYSQAEAAQFRSELYRVELDGSCRARLTRDALQDLLPSIVPAAGTVLGGCRAPTPLRELPSGPS
jgi:hypothetical protein